MNNNNKRKSQPNIQVIPCVCCSSLASYTYDVQNVLRQAANGNIDRLLYLCWREWRERKDTIRTTRRNEITYSTDCVHRASQHHHHHHHSSYERIEIFYFFGLTLPRQFRSGKFHCFACTHPHLRVSVCVAVRTQTISFGPHESKQKSRKNRQTRFSLARQHTRTKMRLNLEIVLHWQWQSSAVAAASTLETFRSARTLFGKKTERTKNGIQWICETNETDHRPTERCEAYK